MSRVSANRPHLIQARIRRGEGACISDRIGDAIELDGLISGILASREADESIAERAFRPIGRGVRCDVDRIDTEIRIAESLHFRLAILHRHIAGLAGIGLQLDASGDLAAEVKKDLRRVVEAHLLRW